MPRGAPGPEPKPGRAAGDKSIIIIGNQASAKARFPSFPWQIPFFGSDFPILVSEAGKETGMGLRFPAPQPGCAPKERRNGDPKSCCYLDRVAPCKTIDRGPFASLAKDFSSLIGFAFPVPAARVPLVLLLIESTCLRVGQPLGEKSGRARRLLCSARPGRNTSYADSGAAASPVLGGRGSCRGEDAHGCSPAPGGSRRVG